MIGLYGLMAYTVGQRTREIGIRVALGAEPRSIGRLVLRQGLGLTVAGLVVGLGAALAVPPLLASQLAGLEPIDPVSFVATAVALSGATLVAAILPARRATRVDPLLALRHE